MSRLLILGLVVFVWRHLIQRLGHRFSTIVPSRIKSFWHTLPPVYHNLATHLVMGLSIMLLLLAFHDRPWLIDIEDEGMDWAMQIRKAIIPPIREKDIPPFVLLDIDNETHRYWDEPLFIPRNRLRELIEVAVNAEARLVVVDIDLSQKMPTAGLEKFTENLHPYDKDLHNYLAHYTERCKNSICPPIILKRDFRAHTSKPGTNSKDSVPVPKPHPSFLDDAVTQSTPYVQWASALFWRSPFDQVVRRWWLWQPTCTQPSFIPSIELLVATIIRNDTLQQAQDNLKKALLPKSKDCANAYVPTFEPISIGENLTITTNRRIMYSMPWQPPTKENIKTSLLDEEDKQVLTIFQAQYFAKSPPTHTLSPEILQEHLKGKIVVISGSYQYGRDIYPTPLGNMPGALIVINAIHSLLQYGGIDSLSAWHKIVWTAIAIIIMSLTFTFFGPSLGNLLPGIFVIFVLVPFSIILFGNGVWLDFMLPLLTVQYHQTATDYHQMMVELKELRKQKAHQMTADFEQVITELKTLREQQNK